MKAKLLVAVVALTALTSGIGMADLQKPTCKPGQIDSVELGQQCARYHRNQIADLKAEIRKLREKD